MRYFVCRRKRGYKSMKNKAINAMCRKGTSYAPRKKTDVLFQMPAGSFNYKGMADRSARLIQDEYLINKSEAKRS